MDIGREHVYNGVPVSSPAFVGIHCIYTQKDDHWPGRVYLDRDQCTAKPFSQYQKFQKPQNLSDVKKNTTVQCLFSQLTTNEDVTKNNGAVTIQHNDILPKSKKNKGTE